jgi:hypothetical protein
VRTVHARVSPAALRHISDIGGASRGGLLDLRKGTPQPAHEFLNGEAAAARTPVGMDLVAISFDRQGDRAQEGPVRVGTPGQAAPIGSGEDPHAARKRGQSREGKLNCLQRRKTSRPFLPDLYVASHGQLPSASTLATLAIYFPGQLANAYP